MKNSSSDSSMQPSGQMVLHIPHFVHFSWSNFGLKTRHEPVLLFLAFPGREEQPIPSATSRTPFYNLVCLLCGHNILFCEFTLEPVPECIFQG